MLNLTQPVLGKDGSIFDNTFQQVSEEGQLHKVMWY